MKLDKKLIGVLLGAILTLSVLSVILYRPVKQTTPQNEVLEIVNDCVKLCVQASYETNLSSGPCLSDLYPNRWKHPGWVCDVAHWPRKEIDDKPENQCKEYGKTAFKFVEVDPDCKPIRIYTPETGEIVLAK